MPARRLSRRIQRERGIIPWSPNLGIIRKSRPHIPWKADVGTFTPWGQEYYNYPEVTTEHSMGSISVEGAMVIGAAVIVAIVIYWVSTIPKLPEPPQ